MIRYCLKPRTKAALDAEARKLIPSTTTLRSYDRRGGHAEGTPPWFRGYMSLPCVKEMTPAQASRDLGAHLKRWKEERDWGKGPGACDLNAGRA
jgi:hypothetical protein